MECDDTDAGQGVNQAAAGVPNPHRCECSFCKRKGAIIAAVPAAVGCDIGIVQVIEQTGLCWVQLARKTQWAPMPEIYNRIIAGSRKYDHSAGAQGYKDQGPIEH